MGVIQENLSRSDDSIDSTTVPCCSKCGSNFVKPEVVFFDEDLPDHFYDKYPADFEKCDLLIIAGTSLEVYPFASLCEKVAKNVKRFLVNNVMVKSSHKFHFKGNRDRFICADVQDFALAICERLGWGVQHRSAFEDRKTISDSFIRVS
jgi:NAD-dependent SIR2 family protein deacetylase